VHVVIGLVDFIGRIETKSWWRRRESNLWKILIPSKLQIPKTGEISRNGEISPSWLNFGGSSDEIQSSDRAQSSLRA
jgi:hypothetical protein